VEDEWWLKHSWGDQIVTGSTCTERSSYMYFQCLPYGLPGCCLSGGVDQTGCNNFSQLFHSCLYFSSS